MKHKYEGWKGTPVQSYFNHWDSGEWVEITRLKYIWLKINGYKVRKTIESGKNNEAAPGQTQAQNQNTANRLQLLRFGFRLVRRSILRGLLRVNWKSSNNRLSRAP